MKSLSHNALVKWPHALDYIRALRTRRAYILTKPEKGILIYTDAAQHENAKRVNEVYARAGLDWQVSAEECPD